MVETAVVVPNKTGLHARPASQLTNVAKGFKSKITLTKNDQEANAKSIMSVLACNISQGSEVMIRANGEDEDQALSAVTAFILALDE